MWSEKCDTHPQFSKRSTCATKWVKKKKEKEGSRKCDIVQNVCFQGICTPFKNPTWPGVIHWKYKILVGSRLNFFRDQICSLSKESKFTKRNSNLENIEDFLITELRICKNCGDFALGSGVCLNYR